MSKAATLANIPSYSFMRNRIINGSMDVWQRGTSFSNMGGSTSYTADRWSSYRSGYASNITVSQVTGLTIDTGINRNALRVQRTAGDTSTATLFLAQSLESINSRDLAGQPVTLSFWARRNANFSEASNAITVQVFSGTGTDEAIRNGATGGNTFINTATTLSTSFVRYTFTGTVPTNCNQLHVLFRYTPTGTAGAADSFDITDVQLEPGPAATPFERRPFGQELQLCQRYFEKSYNLTATPGSASFDYGPVYVGTLPRQTYAYKVSKRVAATNVLYRPDQNNVTGQTSGGFSITVTESGTEGFAVNTNANPITGDFRFNWVASAEL